MNYIYGKETSPNEKLVTLDEALELEAQVKFLRGEIQTAHVELNKHGIVDKEFPLVMRVKGLVDHAKALAALVEGKNKPQRQDSLCDQLKDMIAMVNREGCYDAADFLRQTVENIERKQT